MQALTASQIFTAVLSIVTATSISAGAVIYSNSRISEAKETLRAEIAEIRSEMRAGFSRIEAAIAALDVNLSHKLQVHELEHHRK
ncbi:MAG TPA: hypothetical protein VNY05_32235 [Candidatus Acidoferrales bacterium]|jgi:hypothetical protein|nr:hypothetical protein [Candidatus Acidoferrales bacterium]